MPMTLSINPVAPIALAQATTLADVLTPGTVVDARVLKVLDANLVRLAIASLTIDVATETPVQVGQSLKLAVTQTAQGLALSIADVTNPKTGEAVAPKQAASPAMPMAQTEQARAVQAVVRDAATRQNGLAPLFANLDAAAAMGKLPAQVQPVAAQVLALRPQLDPDLTGPDIKSAFQASGLFREAQPSSGPDLKAALIVLRQTLAAFLTSPEARSSAATPSFAADTDVARSEFSSAQASIIPPSPSTMAGRSPAQAIGPLPTDEVATATATATTAPAVADVIASSPVVRAAASPGITDLLRAVAHSPDLPASDLPAETLLGLLQLASKAQPGRPANADHAITLTPPPPFRGALPSPQPIVSSSIAPDATPVATAARLLDDTDSAIARQTLLQVASLPDRADIANPRLDTTQPRWAFEIPFVTLQGTAVAQFEISRDGDNETEASATSRVWRARFSLDVEPAGPVHALISLNGETTSVRLWAERPATAAQLRSNAGQLGHALSRADIVAGDIVIQQGAPAAVRLASAGHFLDRAT